MCTPTGMAVCICVSAVDPAGCTLFGDGAIGEMAGELALSTLQGRDGLGNNRTTGPMGSPRHFANVR
jgi:hypothetical protein